MKEHIKEARTKVTCGCALGDTVGLFFLALAPLLCGAATTVRFTVPGRFFPRTDAELADTGGALIVIGT